MAAFPRVHPRTLLFLTGLNLYGLILLEVLFRAFTPFPISTETGFKIYHEILGSVENSYFPGIDAEGFRNVPSANRIEFVSLGDSNTFGLAAPSAFSWPQQLAKLVDKTGYNYGGINYGPLQYLYLMDKAIEKRPDTVVLGFSSLIGLSFDPQPNSFW